MQLPKLGLDQKVGPSIFSSGKYFPLSFISKCLQELHTLERSAAWQRDSTCNAQVPS